MGGEMVTTPDCRLIHLLGIADMPFGTSQASSEICHSIDKSLKPACDVTPHRPWTLSSCVTA